MAQPLAHFTSLNPSVFLHRPPPPPSTTLSSSGSKPDPDLILLLGWMSATPRHVSKYTSTYETLFPSSTILAVTTMVNDAVFSTTSANLKRIAPVLEYLYSLPPDAKVLLHFFSNGGLFTASMIARAHFQKTGRAINIQATVIDSAPGTATLMYTIRAMAVSLPKNAVLYFLGRCILGVMFFCYKLSYLLKRKDDIVEEGRKTFNDKRMVGHGPRLYLYSREDPMVDWREVVRHGEEAEERGYRVTVERFEGSGHAAHMMLDGKRYWGAVEKLWASV